MKAIEMRSKTKEQLNDELLALLREQFNLRMQRATGQLANNSQLSLVRRSIARVKTVLNEMQRVV